MNKEIIAEIKAIRECLARPEPEGWPCRQSSSVYDLNIGFDNRGREVMPDLRHWFIDFYENARKLCTPQQLHFELYGPDCGWIHINIRANNLQVYKYVIGEYGGDDAFYKIIRWLEVLTTEDKAFTLIDAEDIYALWGFEINEKGEGMFFFIDDTKDAPSLYGICAKRELVKGLYEAIMYFSSAPRINGPKYSMYWRLASSNTDFDIYDALGIGWEGYEQDLQNGTPLWREHMIFHEVYRSEIIEEYLKNENNG